MKILFLHGWHSTPGGVKPTYLKDHGHEVLNPALPDDDFDAAVCIAQAEFDQHHPDFVVGSSRGGAVAMNINSGSTPLVLLCPAWKKWGTARTVKPGTVILHSGADEVVPFGDSLELVRNSGLYPRALLQVGHDHRLADEHSLKTLEIEVRLATVVPQAITQEARNPSQFGIGTLLFITALYAVLFGVLRALDESPFAFLVVTVFVTAVGLGQRLLYQGRRPRLASVIVGVSIAIGFMFVGIIRGEVIYLGVGQLAIIGSIVGAFYGFVVGRFIANIFLLVDLMKDRRG